MIIELSHIVGGLALLFAAGLLAVVRILSHINGLNLSLAGKNHELEIFRAELQERDRAAHVGSEDLRRAVLEQLNSEGERSRQSLHQLNESFGKLNINMERRVGEMQTQMLERLAGSTQALGKQLREELDKNAESLSKSVGKLTEATDQRLKEISGQVDERLKEGFEKTTTTFGEVLKRLALIDEAQKKITELSGNVVSLQEILADKRSRGAYGEVQLASLVENVMPPNHVELQATLPNGKRVDCLLKLPKPTGNVCIDAKFPLESYQRLSDIDLSQPERDSAARQFKQDIKKHIGDIADKYIITDETAAGAIMFVPAESVFAEIHARHSELVQIAHQKRVWMCSPSTLMAVLTTAKAVLRDDALRQQTDQIREHLNKLHNEFDRFKVRMNKLSQHIRQAHEDTQQINTTAEKISKGFAAIEQTGTVSPELSEAKMAPLAQE